MRRVLSILTIILLIGVTTGCAIFRSEQPSPTEIVRQYVDLTNKGDMAAAWELIHPDRRTPEIEQRFLSTPSRNPLHISSVADVRRLSTWDDALKRNGQPGGETWKDVAEVQIKWESGTTQTVHLARDGQGRWRLIWSPQFALE